jgi:hypothetical protein
MASQVCATMPGMSRTEGPAALGRGVIIEAGAPVPEPWAAAPRVVLDEAALASPEETVEQLHALWASRSPVVIDLRVAREALAAPETDDRPAFELTPAFDFLRERCYFLTRANNYDARDGTLRWGAAAEAVRLGASVGGAADVMLPS